MLTSPPRAPILLIVTYFGRFGPWFPLFLHGLGKQRALDLLLVTDAECPPLPANARRLPMTLDGVRDRATAALEMPVCLENTRKLCDLKPAYGLLFQQFAAEYEYWAFGDEDVLYGDLDRFLAPALARADVIVPSRSMTVGHLTILRTVPLTLTLAKTDPNYASVLAAPEYRGYDEAGHGEPWRSFTARVKAAEAAGDLRVAWGLPIRGGVPWRGRSYGYDGRTIRDNDGTEIMYYHWGRFRRQGHRFPTAEQAPLGFAFDRYGFYERGLGSTRNRLRRTRGFAREVARWIGRQLPPAVVNSLRSLQGR